MSCVDVFANHYGWTLKDVLSLSREEHELLMEVLKERTDKEAAALRKK